ncbi:cysteine proteinase, partial [Ramicandelaber brevisporus]
GNSCFLNAILQAFASLRSLEDYLHDNLESMDNVHQRTAHPILRMPVTEALEETLWYLNSSQRKRGANSLAMNAFRPRRIMDALSHNRRIMNLEQQDAQEAFQMISSALSDEMDVLAKVQRNVSSVHLGRTNSVELARRKAVGPFSGTLASRLTCAACGYNEAIRHFPFDNISLTLPLANQCLLTDTLASYVDIESLTDVVCRKCSLKSTKAVYEKRLQALKLSGNRRVVSVDSSDDDDDYDDDDDDDSSIETLSQKLAAVDYALQYDVQATLPEGIELKRAVSPLMTKQTMIARPPAILCLHISRSTLTPYGDIIKNRCHVHSPEFLDVTPYCTSGYLQTKHNEMISPLHDLVMMEAASRGHLYRLQAVVVHYGSHSYGHFITFRRKRSNGTASTSNGLNQPWYEVSDEIVAQVGSNRVLGANPYMLLYERVSSA